MDGWQTELARLLAAITELVKVATELVKKGKK